MFANTCLRRLGAGAGAVLALAAGDARAAAAPPFIVLLREAEARAPRIAAARADVDRARGLSDQAAVRPNPTAGLTVENFAGGRPFSGLSGAETTLELSQPFELGGKRAARTGAARAGIAAADAKLAQARADFAHDLAVAYIEAEAATNRAAIARETLALARSDADAVAALVRAGKEAEVRSLQARAALAAAEGERAALETELAADLARLSALAAATEPFTGTTGSVLAAQEPATGPAKATAPALAAAMAERDAAAGRAAIERTRAAPDLTASIGVRRNGLEDTATLIAGVSAPLPLFDRNRGNVTAALAEVRAADARVEAARREAEADLGVARAQLGSAEARLAAARAGEGGAREAADLTRIGYEGGKLPLLELIAARRTATEMRVRVLDAQLARAKALAEIARLQGRTPFEGTAP